MQSFLILADKTHASWYLLPLALTVSLVYSATRFDQWSAILHEAFRWGLRLAGFLGAITLVLYLVTRF